MLIVLKDNHSNSIAETNLEDGKWWFIGDVGSWKDTLDEAFDYSFPDKSTNENYKTLKDYIEEDMEEVLNAYSERKDEFNFYK
ncbi:hypothetical protein [Clostridium fallax]|uniref:Uncharacterized protein n=1 Tax=Clostridium fallax TaxID=1533 RepID=A0A1M4XU14_9CLOT|nr:hypothetical protein [Clostridium fallax]SHE96732.1 hypothetical protein SAMN05443638_1212 [Clostridium fallax]SQB06544.1 Uncharacterised protein [Clostridium fallax]